MRMFQRKLIQKCAVCAALCAQYFCGAVDKIVAATPAILYLLHSDVCRQGRCFVTALHHSELLSHALCCVHLCRRLAPRSHPGLQTPHRWFCTYPHTSVANQHQRPQINEHISISQMSSRIVQQPSMGPEEFPSRTDWAGWLPGVS